MAPVFLTLKDVDVTLNGKKVLHHLSLEVRDNEYWAVTGPSGSGKTALAHAIAGRHFVSGLVQWHSDSKPSVMVVEQQHRFKNLSNVTDFYYQQRFNASDAEDAATVQQALELDRYPAMLSSGIATAELPSILHIEHVLNEPLIQLSNGENKRLQIARAILQEPDMMILDNPFTGLDVQGRETLHRIISRLLQSGMKLMVITPATEIPAAATHVAILEKGTIRNTLPAADFHPSMVKENAFSLDKALLRLLCKEGNQQFSDAVKMVNVHVRYGDRHILKNINWCVKKGEHWAISGPNGAGKSTLLSLITGDNAQAYANEVYLFDKRRGSGESIWDIKQRIGYVSPEMHIFFDYTATCFETVASGLFDTIGLFRKLTDDQTTLVNQWLHLFHLSESATRRLSALSMGEQRMVLLARALVKNPPLLILDEPCQGLDREHVQQFIRLIDGICEQCNTTLLYVSHYKTEIPGSVTRFMELENGTASLHGQY